MKYLSTRGVQPPIEFQEAVLMGLAQDGGLLVPESIPCVAGVPPSCAEPVQARRDDIAHANASGKQQRRVRTDATHAGETPATHEGKMPSTRSWLDLPYERLALEVMAPFADDLPREQLQRLLKLSYSGGAFSPSPAPTVRVGDIYVLELWHGPTLAFKDIALQFLGNLFEHILARTGGRLNVLGATSGDTGSAAIAGLRGKRGIEVFMMHPHGRVSPIQARQMTTVLDPNVHNIAIDGSFDDCQRIMKDLFRDLDFKHTFALGAVNSVNWARVLAQIVYYFRSALDVIAATGAPAVRVAVPTGNFGDVLAGWYAMQMGAPIRQLILATNENDILARFFNSGVYSLGPLHQTLAPSMDIQVASNFERYLYYKLGRDSGKLRSLMEQFERTGSMSVPMGADDVVDPAFAAASAKTEQVLATIREFHRKFNYVLDPHTAVAVAVATRLGKSSGIPNDDLPLICLATAHAAKFPAAIAKAIGAEGPTHPAIDALLTLPTRCQRLPNDPAAVKDFIRQTLNG
jgi:threonine synthase